MISMAGIESSVLGAKVYFIMHCLGSEDIAPLSSNTGAWLSSRKTKEPTSIPKIKASIYELLIANSTIQCTNSKP